MVNTFASWSQSAVAIVSRCPPPLERSAKCAVLVSKLDRLSRDGAFVSGLMAQSRASALRHDRALAARLILRDGSDDDGIYSAVRALLATLAARFSMRAPGHETRLFVEPDRLIGHERIRTLGG
jgi:hypothetical protein